MASNGRVGGNGGILIGMSMDYRPMNTALTTINRRLNTLQGTVRNLNKIYKTHGDESKRLSTTYVAMGKQLDQLKVKEKELMKQLNQTQKGSVAYEKLAKDVDRVRTQMQMLSANMRKNRDDFARLNVEGDKLRKQFSATNALMKAQVENYKLQGKHVKASVHEQNRLSEAIKKTNNLRRTEEQTLRNTVKRFGAYSTEATQQRLKIKELQNQTLRYSESLKEAGKSAKYFEVRDKAMRTSLGKTLNLLKVSRASLAELRNGLMSFGAGLTIMTFPLKRAFAGSIGSVVAWEEAFAQVRKTVNDASEKEFKQLDKDIMNMSKKIPESATLIAETMGLAAQLGVAKKNLSGFTEVAIQMGVATNMSVEDASQAMARFANVTGMEQTNKNFRKLGSTIVNLGNNLATQEDEISNYMLRLSGTGRTVGMAEQNIIALGAAMSSLGITAESGGSAMSKVMQKINNAVMDGGDKLQQFAEVAGVSATDFSELWKNDPYQALLIFEKGIKQVIDTGGNAKETLVDLGIKELRETDAVLRLANGYNVMADAQGYANEGWEKGTALSDEASERYKTLGSQIQLFKNQLFATGRTIGEALAPHLIKLMDVTTKLLKKIEGASDRTKVMIASIAGIALVLGPLLFTASLFVGVLHQASLALGIFSTSAKAGGVALKITDKFVKLSRIGFKDFGRILLTVAKSPLKLMSGGLKVLGAGLRFLLGPIGLTITALVLIGTAFMKAYKEVDWFREGINAIATIIKEIVIDAFEKLGKAIGFIKDVVKDTTKVFKDNISSWYKSLPEDNVLVKSVDGIKNAFKKMTDSVKQSSKPMDVLEGNISKNTKKILGHYVKLSGDASKQMTKLRHGVLTEEDRITIDQYNFYKKRGLEIPEKVKEQHDAVVEKYKGHASTLKNIYDQMRTESLKKMEQQHKEEKEELQQFFDDIGIFSEEERKETLKKMDDKHSEAKKSTEEYHKEINAIYNKGLTERGYLTEEELDKIEKLEEQAVQNTVKTLSDGEVEQEVILRRLNNNKIAINKEAVEKLVKDSESARDKTIKSAEEERDALIKTAMESSDLTEEQKERAIRAAEEQYEKIVQKAEETHDGVIQQASDQAEQHGIQVDRETGKVLNTWDKMKKKVIEKGQEMWNGFIDSGKQVWKEFYEWADWIDQKAYAITDSIDQFFINMWNSVTGWFSKTTGSINEELSKMIVGASAKWQEFKTKTATWISEMKEVIINKFSEIGESVGNFFGTIWEYIGPPLEAVWNSIKYVFKTQLYILEFIVRGAIYVVKTIVLGLVNATIDGFKAMWNMVTKIVKWLYDGVVNSFKLLYNHTMAILLPLILWIKQKWDEVKNFVIGAVLRIYAKVTEYFTAMKNKVVEIISPWIAWIVGKFNYLRDKVAYIVSVLKNKIVEIWNAISTRVLAIVNNIKEFIIRIWNNIRDRVVGIVGGLRDRVVGAFNILKTRLSSTTGNIKTSIRDGFQWAREKTESIVGKMKEKVLDIFNKMKEGISNRIDDITEFVDNMVDSVKKGLNKLIDGINWVGEKLNMSQTIPHLHTGTTHTTDYVTNGKINQGTLAVVGDKGRGNGPGGFRHEMIEDTKGNLMLTPAEDTVVPLRKGYKVHSGKATYDYFKNNLGFIPKFSQGTSKNGGGGLFKKGLGWISDKISDVMDYIKKPSKLLNKVLETLGFDGFNSIGGIPGDIMKSGYKILKDGIINQFKKWFEETSKGDGRYIDLGKGINFPFSPHGQTPGYPFAGGHRGVDLNYVYDKLYSVLGGKATSRSGWNYGFGNMVDIVQGAIKVIYAHMSKHAFTGTKQVKPGDYLGVSGNSGRSTGPHLHFEVQKNGVPIDPVKWLKDNTRNNNKVSGGATNKLYGGGARKHEHNHDADYDELEEKIKKSPVQVGVNEFKRYAPKGMKNYDDPEDRMMAIVNKAISQINLNALPKYANGGLVRKHQIAHIGEGNKPEMVIPLTKKSRAAELIELARRLVGLDEDGNIEIENNNNFNQFAVDYTDRLESIETTLGHLAMAMTSLAQQGITFNIDGREVARVTYKDTERFMQADKNRRERY